MKISGLTVCVDYAAYLAHGLRVWRQTLDQLVVVTAPRDQDTISLCTRENVPHHMTDVFYSDGAFFNKAAALDVGYDALGPDHWVLVFDADIVPPTNWRRCVDLASPKPDHLYSVARRDTRGRVIPGYAVAGYFQLFHAADPNAANRPLFGSWRSAASYDTAFAQRWPQTHWGIFRDFSVSHLGGVRRNWCGVGNVKALQGMAADRVRLGGFDHERLPAPQPPLQRSSKAR